MSVCPAPVRVPRGPHEEGPTVSPLRVRPLGGAVGCLTMIAVSIVASIVLTVLLNLLLR